MGESQREVQRHPRQAAGLSEYDLWRAREINRGQLSVELVFWQDGHEMDVVSVWGPYLPSLETYGEQQRQHLFWQAFARFLNAGGACADVDAGLRLFKDKGRLLPSDGAVLFEQNQDTTEVQTVWVNPQLDEAVVFVEDTFVEKMTIGELHRHATASPRAWRQLENVTQTKCLPGASAEAPD